MMDLVGSVSKYSALNLLPLTKLGTIEFRAMEGTDDLNRIIDWIGILTSLNAYCQKTSLDVIVAAIKTLNTTSLYEAFKQDVFGPRYAQLVDAKQTQPHMSDCIKYVKECLSTEGLGNERRIPPEKSGLMVYYREQAAKLQKVKDPFSRNGPIKVVYDDAE